MLPVFQRIRESEPTVPRELAEWAALTALRRAGVPLSRRKTRVTDAFPIWNGRNLAVGHIGIWSSDPYRRAALLLHELGHWLVASPAERLFFEYRLGPDPSSDWLDEDALPAGYGKPLPESRAKDREELASALGILTEFASGLHAGASLGDQGWVSLCSLPGNPAFDLACRRLFRLRLISADCVPRFLG